MIFEDAYERSVNSQDYDNKQRKNYKEEKTNRTKIEIEAVMTTKTCITVLLYGCNVGEHTLDFRPVFGPLFVIFLITTKNKNEVQLKHIVNYGHDMFAKPTRNDHTDLFFWNITKKFDALVTIGECMHLIDHLQELDDDALTTDIVFFIDVLV